MDFDRLDKTAFTIVHSHEEAEEADRQFWWAKTPSKRIRAVQQLRRLAYGDAADEGFCRVLEVLRVEPR